MKLHVISTGSKGNCYVLHGDEGFLLLDCGVCYSEIVRAVHSFRGLYGCLISHEHGDHTWCMNDLIAIGVQVFMSPGTQQVMTPGHYWPTMAKTCEPDQAFILGEFIVRPFHTQHDAAEPFGYLIRQRTTGETLVYMTDTHYSRFTFPGVHYWIVECNYVDEILKEQLQAGKLPQELRNRLYTSHFSLRRLKEALAANDLSVARQIVLVHLSDERSDEARMVREIEEATGVPTIAADDGMMIQLGSCPF